MFFLIFAHPRQAQPQHKTYRWHDISFQDLSLVVYRIEPVVVRVDLDVLG